MKRSLAPRSRRSPLQALLGAAIALLGCGGQYDLSLRFASPALLAQVETVEVFVLPRCDATVVASGGAPTGALLRQVLPAGGTTMPLGNVPPGHVGLYARSRNGECRVFAAGCAEFDLRAGGSGLLVVPLDAVGGPGCDALSQCERGTCTPATPDDASTTRCDAAMDCSSGGTVDARPDIVPSDDAFDAYPPQDVPADRTMDALFDVPALQDVRAECGGTLRACGASCYALGDPAHCGPMCVTCPTPANATRTCDGVSCGFTCDRGYADCDGLAANGCEAYLLSNTTCGGCSNACAAGSFCASTGGGTCVTSCDASGLTACGGRCTDTSSDPMNCGGCARPCTRANSSCVAGACVCPAPTSLACPTACVNPTLDGNCGACGVTCATTLPGSRCNGSTCACPAGERVCAGACTADSPTACGVSCMNCTVPAHGRATCTSGACGIACDAGYVAVGGTCQCGGLGQPCCGAMCNAGGVCSGGTCQCGVPGGPCCSTTPRCSSAFSTCTGGVCSCGAGSGDACCTAPGSTPCGSPLECVNDAGSNRCRICGTAGFYACASTGCPSTVRGGICAAAGTGMLGNGCTNYGGVCGMNATTTGVCIPVTGDSTGICAAAGRFGYSCQSIACSESSCDTRDHICR